MPHPLSPGGGHMAGRDLIAPSPSSAIWQGLQQAQTPFVQRSQMSRAPPEFFAQFATTVPSKADTLKSNKASDIWTCIHRQHHDLPVHRCFLSRTDDLSRPTFGALPCFFHRARSLLFSVQSLSSHPPPAVPAVSHRRGVAADALGAAHPVPRSARGSRSVHRSRH